MEVHNRLLERRKFLKKGITGGVLMALVPLVKTLNFASTRSESLNKRTDCPWREVQDRILKITRRYGAEFGKIQGGS